MLHKCRHWFNFYVQFYFLLGINVQELNFVSLLIIQVVVGTRIRLSSNSGGRYTEGHLIEKKRLSGHRVVVVDRWSLYTGGR